MFCPECGTENAQDASFCQECGFNLAELTEADSSINDTTTATQTQGENTDASSETVIATPPAEQQEQTHETQASTDSTSGNMNTASADHLGPYELRGELGRGAMARVWRAWDPNLAREVAIKEPLFDTNLPQGVLEEMGKRFVSEGRAAGGLNHPGIVTIHAADVYDGRPAIVMELIDGTTLSDLLERGKFTPSEALSVLDQLLDAVGYAHKQGIVHRDIKPDNIFITSDGRVKLTDFGIARVEDSGATRATMVGTVLGTPGYMSPEQATGKPVDARSDLFSVGVVGYEMLTGSNPFGTGDSTTLLYRIVHEPAEPLPEAASTGLPADLRPGIMAALQKDPAQRPPTATDMKSMLHGGATVVSGTAVQAPLAQKAAATGGGIPKWAPYAAVAAVLVGILIFVFAGATGGSGGGMGSPATTGTATGNAATGNTQVNATATGPAAGNAYLGVEGDFVAIYTNQSSAPYQITNLPVSDLDPTTAAQLSSFGFSTVDEASAKVEELRAHSDAAKKAAEEEAARKKAEEEEAARKKAEEEARNSYIFPDSDSRYLSQSELSGKTSDELSIAQNEIWARHGRRFKNNWLQSTFDSKSWYNGTIQPDNFLNVYKPTAIEDSNSKLIASELSARGYDVNKAHPN